MKDTLTYYNEIKEIIHSKKIDRLLRYLKSIPSEDFEKVIKATNINSDLSIWSYFNATVQLDPLSRGQRGDNGIGRERAAYLRKNTPKYQSMGMHINDERINLLSKTNDFLIEIRVEDKFSDNNVAEGTRVIIRIPIA